jgi:hypothetical protein
MLHKEFQINRKIIEQAIQEVILSNASNPNKKSIKKG